ncbi:cytochrome c oxidase subunit II [Sphingomonas koreensis]|jgi:cytochrome c oxidase subunit 2|uniref:Cytochrome aa3 subunit 2 n=1 Tax=Sphingomonas koreensis TaxID=93064 RepID=A0A1L6JD81_9SPHN|nr:cytochrome c oxidase subunit II [Sphingomonas koreensis]APR53873.1 cytochrome c oxidase subunit II [Sphingomonas koreensis]MDC7808755.1 cytochrome c oxidase subunit II [Sphingomonas koreensis]RSU18946.1 cytochrome c oxidase subunit II [Sphingomonas koreensis]RSU24022.1 cytochrome c oxidase subunit II [Sphingomonas koreensis]RSU26274.1 cytochrome c oxidase subunit II [Sphingomonas koreensis]
MNFASIIPVFDPAGPYAGSITTLSWALIAMAVAVFAVVLTALSIALFGGSALKARLGGPTMVWAGGIVFPVVVLSALLIYGLSLTRNLTAAVPPDAMRVRITGEMWWWRVAYLDARGQPFMLDANELHIPAGRPVLVELESNDVIHSFWVPRLSGKLDMVPGRRNTLPIQADSPGVYAGQCAEYCGGPHALMGFVVVAHAPADFDAWLASRRMPRPAIAMDGAALFRATGCAACHRIAGTDANGSAGPDLTHVGSRRSLGAGILPNNRGTMMGWIGDSQAIKPGNRMPPYKMLSAQELTALATYLESQK